jgi:DNA-binding transcriptional LysR family regulator
MGKEHFSSCREKTAQTLPPDLISDSYRIPPNLKILRQQYPNVRLHSSSGDTLNVYSALDKGVADFGLIFEHPNPETYEFLTLPEEDRFGVLMRQDAPLARKTVITAEDLAEQPLIVQRVMLNMAKQTDWDRDYRKRAKVAGSEHIRYVGNRAEEWRTLLSKAKIAGSYSLLFNASLMVRAGMGYAIGLDRILNLPEEGDLCFRPLSPEWTATPHLIWKRYQVFSKAAGHFLELLREQE